MDHRDSITDKNTKFLSPCLTGCGDHSASYPIVMSGSFPGLERGQCVMWLLTSMFSIKFNPSKHSGYFMRTPHELWACWWVSYSQNTQQSLSPKPHQHTGPLNGGLVFSVRKGLTLKYLDDIWFERGKNSCSYISLFPYAFTTFCVIKQREGERFTFTWV
jgi:hypothetical protein